MDTPEGVPASLCHYLNFGGDLNMSVRNEIKAQIIRAGFTMQEVVDLNMAGRTASPICPQNCSGRASAIKRSSSLPTRWVMN